MLGNVGAKGAFVRLLVASVVLLLVFVCWISMDIYLYSHKRNEMHSDAAVVLGAGINYDQPSPVFRERINHGINLFKQGKVKYLIFTGGVGQGKVFAESEVAKKYAIANGVPPESVYLESASRITLENLVQANGLLKANNLKSVLIVSDPLHMRRAMTMASDLGMAANAAPTPSSRYKSWPVKIRFLIREVYFYIGYLLQP